MKPCRGFITSNVNGGARRTAGVGEEADDEAEEEVSAAPTNAAGNYLSERNSPDLWAQWRVEEVSG